MNNLPLEIIELIIGHISTLGNLYTCLFINKLFYKATLPALWHSPKRARSGMRDVYSHYYYVYLCDPFVDGLGFFGVSNRHHIRRISFCDSSNVPEVTRFLSLLPLLTELVVSRMTVDDGAMDVVARCCRRLQRISLHSLHRITSETIVSLTQHCPHLTGISLSQCRNIPATALLPLLETNGIEQLTVGVAPSKTQNVCHGSTIADILSLLGQHYPSTLQKNPYSISFMRDWARLIRSSNSEWALRLTELCLCYVADETLLMPFLETHTRLKSLTLASCHLKFGTLTAIARFLPDLRRLDLSYSRGFSLRDIKNMVKLGCPQLRLLVLTGCQWVTKEFVLAGPVDRLHWDDLERLRWEPEIPARLRLSRIPTMISPSRRRQTKPAPTPSLSSLLRQFAIHRSKYYDADLSLLTETPQRLSTPPIHRLRSSPGRYAINPSYFKGRMYLAGREPPCG